MNDFRRELSPLSINEFYLLADSLQSIFKGEPDCNSRINQLLDVIVSVYDADRAYVIEGDVEPVCAINSYERVAKGAEHQQDTLKDMPQAAYERWKQIFLRQEEIVIEDMESIRESYPDEYRFFAASDVSSILMMPFNRRICRGFVGVDNPRKHKTDLFPIRLLCYALVLELDELKLINEKNALLFGSTFPDNVVKIKLFGGLEISAKGGALTSGFFTAQSRTILMAMLLDPKARFSVMELFDISGAMENNDNQAVVVSNTIYKIRNKLLTIGLKELIQNEDGQYFLNPNIQIESDVSLFRELHKTLKAQTDENEILRLSEDMMAIYSSPLPRAVHNSVRCLTDAMGLEADLVAVATNCVELCMKRDEYERAFTCLQRILKIVPDDGSLLLLMARVWKKIRKPGLKKYVRSISRYLDESELKEVEALLSQSGGFTAIE